MYYKLNKIAVPESLVSEEYFVNLPVNHLAVCFVRRLVP